MLKGLGCLEIMTAGPLLAGSRASIALRYTAGPKGLKKGGSLRITIPHGFTTPQVDEFYKEGFVTVGCPKEGVSLAPGVVSKIFCAYRAELGHSGALGKNIFVRLEQGELLEGEIIEITYGDISYYGSESWGPRPPRVPELSGIFEFTAAVDCDGSKAGPVTGYYLLPDSPKLAVLPQRTRRLIALAESNTEEKERVRLKVIQVDRYLNPVQAEAGEFKVEFAGKQHTCHLENGVLELPPLGSSANYMTYQVSMKTRPRVSGSSNPVKKGNYMGQFNLYWGDIHAHSSFSDGLGTPEDLLAFARDTAGLDFSAVTDHDDIGPYLAESEWAETGKAVSSFNEPGQFVTFLAYEYRSELADMVVYYPSGEGKVMCGKSREWNSPEKLLPKLKSLGAMIIPHQHFGADWRGFDPEIYRVMEIYSQHGSAEYRGCPRQIPFLTRQLQKNSAGNQDATFQEILALGARLGVTAGSDSHSGRPGLSNWTRVTRTYNGGLTAVFAGNKTREEIWKAIYSRHCYATSGPRIYLEFSLNGFPMGSELKAAKRSLKAYCIGAGALARVEVIKNTRAVKIVENPLQECVFTMEDTPERDEDYYYVRVTQRDGEMAWSSPIWVGRD